MKRLIDVKTEIRKGDLWQVKHWSDGTKEEKRIDDAQMSKLMRAILDQGMAAEKPQLRVIKGGKQAGGSEMLALIACALIWGLIMTIGATQEDDDHCTRAGWAKHADCLGDVDFN